VKTFTKLEFIKLIATAEVITDSQVDGVSWAEEELTLDVEYGYIWNTLIADGLEVTYQEAYQHPVDKPSLITTTDDIPETWNIDRLAFNVIDDNRDILENDELWDIIDEHTQVTVFNFSVLGVDTVITLPGTDADNRTTVENFGGANIAFTGDIIAQVSTNPNNSHPDYSGSVGLWSEYVIYKTTHDAIVFKRVEGTQWGNSETKTFSMVSENENDILSFFGDDELAKQLYIEYGLNNS